MLIQGPTVMPEYWQSPAGHGPRCFTTTDGCAPATPGCIDDEGMLSIVDRIKDVIIVGSCNVYPADVESVLADCPQIAEAAVIGRPDDELGEVPVAFVVLKRGRRSERRRRSRPCSRDQLAAYKHPHDVVFLDELPRGTMGKVDVERLRQDL